MPRQRQPRALWHVTRRRIWLRDQGRCQGPYCQEQGAWSVPLDAAHIDHIVSGRQGSNADDNLRVLCQRCHVLRADRRHQGMITAAIRAGLIPPDWRRLVWDDG
jgi:5-methylcytosine-specific restriction endonuclease McrA